MRKLNDYEASQFALMQLAGCPVSDAVTYFLSPAEDERDIPAGMIADAAVEWPSQPEVLEALRRHSGGIPWHEMDRKDRLKLALDKHEAEMAYFLWSHNYNLLEGQEKLKADTCRQHLASKLSGTVGSEDPINRFLEKVLRTPESEKTPTGPTIVELPTYLAPVKRPS